MPSKISKEIKVYFDSDVVISSLLSKTGAAYALIQTKSILKFISDKSIVEIQNVSQRFGITLYESFFNDFKLVEIKESKSNYSKYVNDQNDEFILKSAVVANTEFLLSFNLKDYKADLIRRDLGLKIMLPGLFLQYLRSVGRFPEDS